VEKEQTMSESMTIRGFDHIGLAVRDIEAASSFLEAALDAEIIYETLKRSDKPQAGAETETRLHMASGAKIVAIRMLRVGNGPGIELFEISASDQPPREVRITGLAARRDRARGAEESHRPAVGITRMLPDA
jgi:catechol 2,3-dioxygenase-like lactoylglutathione lyase family enzyme